MAVNTREEAAAVLAGARGDKRFYAVDECVYGNLSELAGCLEHMNEETYTYHANASNNDFSNWVSGVLHDDKLASDLSKAPNACAAAVKVRERIAWLKKKAR